LGMKPLEMKEPEKSSRTISPETYLGSARANRSAFKLSGPWLEEEEKITAQGDDCTIEYDFLATNVYLVMSGYSKTPVEVTLDGKFDNKFIVDGDRKYDIVKTNYGKHHLLIKVPKGVSAYAFTFGDE
jgi:hypothetical protein